jgi:hypothetical protein
MKKVRLADFKPTVNTIEQDQVAELVGQFRCFLENAFNSIEQDGDTLPMLQME